MNRTRSNAGWLVAVALAFTACQFLFVPPHMGLGFDETVYVSQVSPYAPAAFFSAPRARGISFLVAPVAVWTSSTVVLRCYLTLLSGAGLLGALWTWRRFLSDRTLALAGLVFAGLWITQFYGPQAMPNLWVAFGALACVGFYLRSTAPGSDRRPESGHGRMVPVVQTDTHARQTRRWACCGTALCLAVVVELRPPDGFWLALPLTLAALVVRRWRCPAVFFSLGAGLVAGGVQWVIESYTRYRGVRARLHTSSQVEGGLSWNLAFGDQLKALGGRTLCRPCTVPWQNKADSLWWFVVPVLVAVGVYAARRAGRRTSALLPTLCGLSMAAPYLVLINYSAPRFLLPTYALLSLPVAECLAWLSAGAGVQRFRRAGTALVILALAGQVVTQNFVLTRTVTRSEQAHADYARVASRLHELGVTPPCLVIGTNAIPIGYAAGCASGATEGHNEDMTAAGVTAASRHRPVAVLVPRSRSAPVYARHWGAHSVTTSPELGPYTAYVAPAARNLETSSAPELSTGL